MRTSKQAEGKVRILADVNPDVREKLDAVCEALNVSRKAFIQSMIELHYEQHIQQRDE